MTISDQAAIAAAEYVSRSIYGQSDGPDADDLRHGRELVMVIAPHILAAERERVASLARDDMSALLTTVGDALAEAFEGP